VHYATATHRPRPSTSTVNRCNCSVIAVVLMTAQPLRRNFRSSQAPSSSLESAQCGPFPPRPRFSRFLRLLLFSLCVAVWLAAQCNLLGSCRQSRPLVLTASQPALVSLHNGCKPRSLILPCSIFLQIVLLLGPALSGTVCSAGYYTAGHHIAVQSRTSVLLAVTFKLTRRS
jgi:hypothetical protein